MTFDLSDFSITTIGYGEPTLWVAIALASVVAILVGHVLGRLSAACVIAGGAGFTAFQRAAPSSCLSLFSRL